MAAAKLRLVSSAVNTRALCVESYRAARVQARGGAVVMNAASAAGWLLEMWRHPAIAMAAVEGSDA